MKSKDLSKRVIELMKEKGISYAELSAKTGVSSSSLQRYFAGDTKKIPFDAIEAVAPVLGVSPAYLLGWEEEKKETSLETIAAHALRDLTEDEIKAVITLAKHIKSEKK